MTKQLSEDERKLLEQYQALSDSIPSLANRLAVEIIPAILFVAAGIYTGSIIWFIVLITIMVTYNVQRIIRQQKNIKKLKAISEKTIGDLPKKR